MVRNTYNLPARPLHAHHLRHLCFHVAEDAESSTPSISGYHNAGSRRDGLTWSSPTRWPTASEYARAGVAAGLESTAFAPRLSFFWAIGMNYFMEIAKMRARPPAVGQAHQGRVRATGAKSLALRTHCQTSGWSLTAQDAFNNVTRTAIEALAATHGGTQSLHTNALDEAIALPTDFSARIARNTSSSSSRRRALPHHRSLGRQPLRRAASPTT